MGCFACWRSQAACMAQQRATLLSAISRLQNGKLAQALDCWSSQVQLRMQQASTLALCLERGLSRMVHKRAALALDRWCTQVALFTDQRALLGRILGKIRHCHLFGALNRWRAQTDDVIATRSTLIRHAQRIVVRMQTVKVAAAVRSWKEQRISQTRLRTIVSKALVRWRQTSLSAAWAGWRTQAARAKIIARSRVQTATRLQGMALLAWAEAVCARARPRQSLNSMNGVCKWNLVARVKAENVRRHVGP